MADQPITTRPATRRPLGRLIALAFLALALIAPTTALVDGAGSPAPELELPPDVEVVGSWGKWLKVQVPLGRVYGNATTTHGIVAITGGTLDDVCSNGAPPTATLLVREKADGTFVVRTLPWGEQQSVSVYETDLDVFEFFGASCPLFGTDAFPQPFATGHVVLRDKAWDQSEPFPEFQSGRYRNGISGWVTDGDGTKYRIRALVDYEADGEGPPTFFRDVLKLRPVRW